MSAASKRDSIDRALMHHQLAGVVHVYSPPEQNGSASDRRSQWRIVFTGRETEPIDCNSTTALIVCAALASAELVHVLQKPSVEPLHAALVEIVTALADCEVVADDSAAFERAEKALLTAADLVAGRS